MGQEPTTEPTHDAPAPTATTEAEQTPSETPKVFDEDYVKKLRSEAAANRTRANELEQRLQQFEDRDKTELEKLTERATKAEQKANEATSRLTRFEVAADRGLDAKLAGFLTGSTREEIEAKADELSQLIANREKEQAPAFDGGVRPVTEPPKDPGQAHNDLLLQALGRVPQ